MSTVGKIVLVTLGLIILYDLLELQVKRPGAISGVAGTATGLLAHVVNPATPLVPYAPGYGPATPVK